MHDQAKRYKNNTLASTNGFVAEADHCATYNVKSALHRSSNRAVREANGNRGDYKIIDTATGKVVEEGEMKYYSTAKDTENAMKGYGKKKVVGPKDQLKDIKKIAKKRALKNKSTRPKVAKEHGTVAKNVDDSIGSGKIKSKARTLKESKKITKKALKGKVKPTDIMPSYSTALKTVLVSGALEGAKSGVKFGGGIAIVTNIVDVVNDKKSKKEACQDIAIATTKAAVDGAVKNAAANAAKTTAIYIAEKTTSTVAKTVLRSSAPVVVAISTVEIGKHAYNLGTGEIDGDTFIKDSKKSVATGAAGWAGAEAGAAIGTLLCPGIGTVIGGILGGIGGSIGVSVLLD